jgi:hypothetical protein
LTAAGLERSGRVEETAFVVKAALNATIVTTKIVVLIAMERHLNVLGLNIFVRW